MTKYFTAAALAAALTIPVAAQAATLISDGDMVTITDGSEFFGNVNAGMGGAGTFSVTFTASHDPLNSVASATIGNVVAGEFTDLTLSWLTVASVVIDSIAVTPPVVELGTLFTTPDLTQILQLSWTDSSLGAGFDVEVVAPVPLPAAGGMLLTAVVAGGIAARRKKKEA